MAAPDKRARAEPPADKTAAAPRLICYPVADVPVRIRPAPRERQWMNETGEAYAYRCLPLVIANGHGWEILSNGRHEIVWSGGPAIEDVAVTSYGGPGPRALSHFGTGIVTFDIGCIFRTEPGLDLWVTGPVNRPKDGIAALTGVVETDWAPYTFTMNWKMTCPGKPVIFEPGEPICHIFPVARGSIEATEPEFRTLDDEPGLRESFGEWSRDRDAFIAALKQDDSPARQEGWQKSYFRGVRPDGARGVPDHRTKLKAKDFKAPRRNGGAGG